jgi:hypothetical protein
MEMKNCRKVSSIITRKPMIVTAVKIIDLLLGNPLSSPQNDSTEARKSFRLAGVAVLVSPLPIFPIVAQKLTLACSEWGDGFVLF